MAKTNILQAIEAIENSKSKILTKLAGWTDSTGAALATADTTDTAGSKLGELATTILAINGYSGATASGRASVSGNTITIARGYHDGRGTISVSGGDYSASVNSHSVTTTPAVTPAISGNITDITTTTKPSGTNGTDYWTLDPSGTVTTTGKSTASGKATVGTSGYISSGNKTSADSVIDITPTVGDGTNRYLIKGSCTVAGGGLSGGSLSDNGGSVSVSNGTVTPSVGGSAITNASTYGLTTTKPAGTDGSAYVTFDPGASVTTNGTAKGRGSIKRSAVTRAAITDAHTAGYIPAKTAATVIAADNTTIGETSLTSGWSSDASTNPTIADGTNYYIPVASASASASASIAKQPSASASASQTGMTAGVSSTATDYYFTSTASAASGYSTASASSSIDKGITSGASSSKTASSTETTASDNSKVYLKAAAITASGIASATTTVAPGNVTISANTSAITDKVRVASTPTTTASSLGTYYIAAKANVAANSTGTASKITGTASSGVSTAGYAPATLTGSGSVTGTATAKTSSKDSSVYYFPLESAAGSVTGSDLSGTNDVTVYTTDGTAAGVNISSVIGTKADAEPTSGYYVAFTGSSSATAKTLTAKITTAGYTPTNNSFATRSVSYSATNATKYFPITAATFANTATESVSYSDISDNAPILVSGDYLYINKGYTPNVKISLALLVPDKVSAATTIQAGMLNTVSAYDKDGAKITGDIVSQTASGNVTLNGSTTSKSYPAGYYANAHGATHATVDIPNPTMSYSNGVITASGSWTAGFTTDTSYSNTYTVTAANAIAVLGGAKSVPTPIDALTSAAEAGGDAVMSVSAGYYNAGTVKINSALLTRLQAI